MFKRNIICTCILYVNCLIYEISSVRLVSDYCETGDEREQMVHSEMTLAFWMGLTIQDLDAKVMVLDHPCLNSKTWMKIKLSILIPEKMSGETCQQAGPGSHFSIPFNHLKFHEG